MTTTDRSGGVVASGNPTMNDRRTGIFAGIAIKAPVKAATTAAITLSGAQTIDGVACVAGDRVLVKDQSSGVANGIYVVSTGNWTRATDFDSGDEIADGTLVYVIAGGTTNGNTLWVQTTDDPLTIDTSVLAFSQVWSASTFSEADILDASIAAGAFFHANCGGL